MVEAGRAALVVPFEAWFHGDRWYADVTLPGVASSSYCPFVRLAVARYQPDSIACSPPVADRLRRNDAGAARPHADRHPIGHHDPRGARGARAGGGPRANRVDFVLERCDVPPSLPASLIELTALGPDGDIPAWRPVEGGTQQTTLGANPVRPTIPASARAVRLRVREVELVGADGGAPAPQTATPGSCPSVSCSRTP